MLVPSFQGWYVSKIWNRSFRLFHLITFYRLAMNYITYQKRLDYTLTLIQKEQLQSPVQLAQRFECSEKTARRMIQTLKNLGHNITYSKAERKYCINS